MLSFGKKLNICTHDGHFHADEVFACATLILWADKNDKKVRITRTRDSSLINKADIVVDVGGLYNEKLNRFDHHQDGFDVNRESGIPYASFGLVWKKFGRLICSNDEVIRMIDHKLVTPIDAHDNGINVSKSVFGDLQEYNLARDIVRLFRNTWDEGNKNVDNNFNQFLGVAIKIIEREIKLSLSLINGESEVLKYIEKQREPSILVLDAYLPWDRVVADFRNIYLVVYPDFMGKNWCAEVVKSDQKDYLSDRANFPVHWGGKIGNELESVSGVTGAIFCHKGLFFTVAETKESAIELAKKAIKKV